MIKGRIVLCTKELWESGLIGINGEMDVKKEKGEEKGCNYHGMKEGGRVG